MVSKTTNLGSIPSLLAKWVGSESANAAGCKPAPLRVVRSTLTLPTKYAEVVELLYTGHLKCPDEKSYELESRSRHQDL